MAKKRAAMQRELICKNPACGAVIAVSYYKISSGEDPGQSHHWCAVAGLTFDDEGFPLCKCGEMMMFHKDRVRQA